MAGNDLLLDAVIEANAKIDLRTLPLDAQEGFVLSRIDGTCTVRTLALLVGISEADAAQTVEKLMRLGAVRLRQVKTALQPLAAAVPAKKNRPKELVDLAEDEQQRIWELHEKLATSSHYELLQVARDVAAGDLKAAYYRFSKDFHPDRFFGRKLGSYKPMLETLFRAGKLAYETLSDPALRAVYDRKLPPPPMEDEAARRAALEAHRQRILDARRAKQKNPFQEQIDKAKGYANEAETLFAKGDLVNAAERYSLALAYDPLNDHYQRRHKELLPLAAEVRTRALSASAAKEIARGDFAAAARAFKDAFDIAPANASFAARAAEYLYKQGAELEDAKQLIAQAVEKSPRNGEYRLTQALVLDKLGEVAAARAAVASALALGCETPEAKKLAKRLK